MSCQERTRDEHTIEKLVYQHKVVLDSFLVKLAKVAAAELDQTVEELENKSGIGIALSNGHEVDVFVLDMAKSCAAQGQDGRADLGIADDLDAKDIGESWAAVVAEGAEDEVLALLVEDEDSRQHLVARSVSVVGEGDEMRRTWTWTCRTMGRRGIEAGRWTK